MKRGWCPTVHAPMPSGDGLLLRVKPFGGRLRADDLRAVASVAESDGNGVVEITSRGNLQLRGFTEASARDAAARLVAAGLADADPTREARRNVIATPPCDDALVAALEEMLAQTEGLPPKFCVAVDAGGVLPLVVGGQVAARAPGNEALVRRIGALLSPSACGRGPGRGVSPPNPLPQGEGEFILLAPAFAQTTAAGLRALADLVGNATLRTTPHRAFRLDGAHDPAPFARAGFITDPTDPRLTLSACPGAPACASASVRARADATLLAARGVRDVHVSGCAKGCAHPGPATTLVGIGGRYGFIRYGRAGDAPAITGLTIMQAAEMLR
jgi:precorrin-3B synthase